jgi:hypothetical protein
MKKLLALAALALIARNSSVAHADVVVDHFQVRGEGVFADWDYTQGGVTTHVSVLAGKNKTRTTRGPETTPFLFVEISKQRAGEAPFFSGSAFTEDFQFSFARSLATARVTATNLTLTDFVSGDTFRVDVNLEWQAVAKTSRTLDVVHDTEGDSLLNFHFLAAHRLASATGSVLVNGVQFTPTASNPGFAEILRTSHGEVFLTVQH